MTREEISQKLAAAKTNKLVHTVESLGSEGYYTALQKCLFIMGNSSSGIVEAASFSKYVLNLGNRQKGREKANNVIDVVINEKKIFAAMQSLQKLPKLSNKNIYGDEDAAKKMTAIIKKINYE